MLRTNRASVFQWQNNNLIYMAWFDSSVFHNKWHAEKHFMASQLHDLYAEFHYQVCALVIPELIYYNFEWELHAFIWVFFDMRSIQTHTVTIPVVDFKSHTVLKFNSKFLLKWQSAFFKRNFITNDKVNISTDWKSCDAWSRTQFLPNSGGKYES